MNISDKISQFINIDNVDKQTINQLISATSDSVKGDFCLPCFRLSKLLGIAPNVIAKTVADSISPNELIAKAIAEGGYVNFFLSNNVVQKIINKILLSGENVGNQKIGNGKIICIDYSSVNIAKQMHIGHLGTTAIGNSLYKIYTCLGYKVIGINHLGDYGTQFGKNIVAYKLWGDKDTILKQGVPALEELYIRFHKEEESNPALTVQAREWFVKIENQDPEALELFNFFKQITLEEVDRIYKRLNIKFDSYNGESYYNDKMQPVIDMLRSKNLLVESQGAMIVDLSQYNMPPCLIIKSDGATLYATRDIAAAIDRYNIYHFTKCLYVVASHQNLHFQQYFKVLELASQPFANDLVHVSYGMVSLEEGAMSTRKGNYVTLSDLLDKAVAKASEIINEKNPDLADKNNVAEVVGTGAVIFSAVANSRVKDVVFKFDRVLNFDGETSPYIQYTYVRCLSLISKAGNSYYAKVARNADAYDDSCRQLAVMLNNIDNIILDAANKYEPSIISKYVIDVCQMFNKFYNETRIIEENLSLQNTKLDLVLATSQIIKKCLNLLGISTVDRM